MRYTSLPPATPIGTVEGGGGEGCRTTAELPATAAATCGGTGTVGTCGDIAGAGVGWRVPTAAA